MAMAISWGRVLPNDFTLKEQQQQQQHHHHPVLLKTRDIRTSLRGRSVLSLRELRGAKLHGDASMECKAYSNDVSISIPSNTEWSQKVIELEPYRRGCHIITDKIYRAVPEIKSFQVGLANLFVMHTSASLTINENASPDVPLDMEDSLNKIVPEGNHYRHLDEGFDDMPAHVKSSMMGCSLTIPIKGGRFCLGIWQGIWLNEHRNYGGARKICITIQGVKRSDGRVLQEQFISASPKFWGGRFRP